MTDANLPPLSDKNLQKASEAVRKHSSKSQLFHGLSEESLTALLRLSSIQKFPAGQSLFQQGDHPKHLYFIIEGTVKTMRFGEEGGEAVIRLLRPGDTFMEAVIFMDAPSPITAQPLEDSTLLLVPATAVKKHALADAAFACNLLKIVTHHYKNAMQQIDGIVTKNPLRRVGYYFLKLHIENGTKDMDVRLPFKKSVIASHLGMTPETFSRALQQMRKVGINAEGEGLSLRDADALCQFCDTDTAALCPWQGKQQCPHSTE